MLGTLMFLKNSIFQQKVFVEVGKLKFPYKKDRNFCKEYQLFEILDLNIQLGYNYKFQNKRLIPRFTTQKFFLDIVEKNQKPVYLN